MGWLSVIGAVLQLALFISRRLEANELAESIENAVEKLSAARAERARAARDAILDGSVQPDPDDKYRRKD